MEFIVTIDKIKQLHFTVIRCKEKEKESTKYKLRHTKILDIDSIDIEIFLLFYCGINGYTEECLS